MQASVTATLMPRAEGTIPEFFAKNTRYVAVCRRMALLISEASKRAETTASRQKRARLEDHIQAGIGSDEGQGRHTCLEARSYLCYPIANILGDTALWRAHKRPHRVFAAASMFRR